jgi:hypothetical protein
MRSKLTVKLCTRQSDDRPRDLSGAGPNFGMRKRSNGMPQNPEWSQPSGHPTGGDSGAWRMASGLGGKGTLHLGMSGDVATRL